jgi:hypothetical protein
MPAPDSEPADSSDRQGGSPRSLERIPQDIMTQTERINQSNHHEKVPPHPARGAPLARLEDWFNPARTNDTYVPTGWRGPPDTQTRAVKGHEFGLDLSEEERKALIAFLRTL